jgi:hypothetical protein
VVFLSEFFVLFQFVVLGGGRAEDGSERHAAR